LPTKSHHDHRHKEVTKTFPLVLRFKLLVDDRAVLRKVRKETERA